METDYFRAQVISGGVRTDGTPHCTFGAPIPSSRAEMPDGVFAEWSWNGDLLTIRNDRYGMYPLFYHEDGMRIMLSPSLLKLLELGAPRSPDYDALAAFFRFGTFLGEDTPFKAIRLLPPGTVASWDRGRFTLSGNGLILGAPISPGPAEAVDTFIALFTAAIRKRLPASGAFAVPLSGGKDSRHILFELVKAGCRPRFCVTARYFPSVLSADVEIASEIARALGLDHVIVDQRGSEFEAEIEKNVLTHFCSLEHGWMVRMAEFLRENVDTVYDGIGGDVLSAGLPTDDNISLRRMALGEAGDVSGLAEDLLGKTELGSYLSPELAGAMGRDRAIARFEREMKRHAGAPNPFVSFVFWNRTRRAVALGPFGILSGVATVHCPFLDHDLFDFLCGFTPRMRTTFDLHLDAIRKAYPEYADIPFVNRMKPSAASLKGNTRFARELAAHVAKRRLSRRFRRRRISAKVAAAMVSRRYALANHWFLVLLTYLVQLDSVSGLFA
jgi:asparagine synthase (glutamine-hydrolysing)